MTALVFECCANYPRLAVVKHAEHRISSYILRSHRQNWLSAAINMKILFRSFLGLATLLFWAGTLQAQDISRTFDASPGGRLVLDLGTGGTIVIRGWSRNQVEVNVEIDGRDADQVTVDFDESSSTIEVFSEFESRRTRAEVDMEINVPSNFNLDISTTGGDLDIARVSGTMEGSSMGGDLMLSELSGELNLSTMGGDIELSNSEVDGSLHTMGGDVSISDVTGNIDGTTMGGDVTYDNVRSSRSGSRDEVKISSMGGDVAVDEALFGADVHTMGGNININRAAEYVKATTMGGDIEVEELLGWIEANTMGGDIVVHMMGGTDGDRHVELESMGGDIELTVPSGLGMDIEIEIRLSDEDDWDDYEIVSDFDLEVDVESDDDRRWRSSREVVASGRVGNGSNRIVIRTVNGDVTLREDR
jgi:DUF4097 and DUF4098 domain-containing protein YvlB